MLSGAKGTEVQGQRVLLRVALEGKQLELFGIGSVLLDDEPGDVPTPVIDNPLRYTNITHRIVTSLGVGRRRHQPLVGKNLDVGGVIDGHQSRLVVHHHFLELIHPPQIVSAFTRSSFKLLQLHVLLGVGVVVPAGRQQVPDGASAQKVGHEADLFTVPCVHERAGSSFAIELLDGNGLAAGDIHLDLLDTPRPKKTYIVGSSMRPEPEMKRTVVLGEEARCGTRLPSLAGFPRLELYFGSQPVFVAPETLGQDSNPSAGGLALVPEQEDPSAVGAHRSIQLAVVVDVGNRQGAGRAHVGVRGVENYSPLEPGRGVFVNRNESPRLIDNKEQVQVGVVIHIGKGGSEAATGNPGGKQARGNHVRGKSATRRTAKKEVQDASVCGQEKIEVAVLIEIRRIHPPQPAEAFDAPGKRSLGKSTHSFVGEDL